MEEIKKTCSKCKEEKTLDQYSNKKRGLFGKSARCKSCDTIYHRAHRTANYEKYRAKEKEYKKANRELIKLKSKEYSLRNKQKIAERKRKYRQENQEKLAAQKKQYTSRPEIRRRAQDRENYRRKTDELFRLKKSLRSMFNNIVNRTKIDCDNSILEIIGCSVADFKKHIENQFEDWMTWENRGEYSETRKTWHLDHIIPVCRAKNKEELIQLNHYTNLRPLEAIKNLKKNKY